MNSKTDSHDFRYFLFFCFLGIETSIGGKSSNGCGSSRKTSTVVTYREAGVYDIFLISNLKTNYCITNKQKTVSIHYKKIHGQHRVATDFWQFSPGF